MFSDLLTRLGKNIGLTGPGGLLGGGGGEMKLDPMGKDPMFLQGGGFAPDKMSPMPGPGMAGGAMMPDGGGMAGGAMMPGQTDALAQLQQLLGGGQPWQPQQPQQMPQMPKMADPRMAMINKFPRPPRQFMRGPY